MISKSMEATLSSRILDLACQIQNIPAPTFEEKERGIFLADLFQAEHLLDVEIDSAGNVLGRFPGKGENRHPMMVAAHMDTVFPKDTALTLVRTADRISGPGIGDNSLGLASLVGLIWKLQQTSQPLPGDVWLIGTTGEEGLGDLRGIRAVVERFERPGRAKPIGYLILEGMGLGEIFFRGLGVRRYRITCQTPGGHSWIDYGKPSAIHELARLINCLMGLSLPSNPKTSLNVGIVHGGTSINTISSHAYCELDLRSEQPRALDALIVQVEKLIRDLSRPEIGVHFQIEIIGNRPAGEIPETHPLVHLAKQCLNELGIRPALGIGSTDANIPLSHGLPAICIGLTRGTGAHTLAESIFTRPLDIGMEQLFQIVSRVWKTR